MKYFTFRCDRCGVIRKWDQILKKDDEDICEFCLQDLNTFMEMQSR